MNNLYFKHLLLFTMLLVAMGATAQSTTPVNERIGLSLVDNRSTYDPVGQTNNYVNTLRLNQPKGSNKLTAGMLNEGDNVITVTRTDDSDNSTEVATVNLSATKTVPTSEVIDLLDFYQDGEGAHTGSTTVTQDMLPDNWGTNGSNLIWQASGYAYISGQGGFTYTVPAGYDNVMLQFIIYVGTDARGGYFAYNLNNTGWSVAATATAGGSSSFVVSEVSSGDVISFYGAINQNGYYLNASPDIELIGVLFMPSSYVPTIEVTGNGTTTVYQPNDTINLYGLGDVTDRFSVETATNTHPGSYNYSAAMDANIVLPSGSATGTDFYASANFTGCTTSDPASATMTGHNGWSFNSSRAYNSSAGICMYIQFYGAIIYTMPASFMGNSVNVKVTTSTGDDGAGILVVNNEQHTFTAGSSYTWTNVPVTAGGIIEFKTDGQTYSADIVSIEITSGNGSALNAPSNQGTTAASHMVKGLRPNALSPIAESKQERFINVKIND